MQSQGEVCCQDQGQDIIKKKQEKRVCKGTISCSWLRCVSWYEAALSTKAYLKWMPRTAFGLPAIKHQHKTVSRAMSSRSLWHNCNPQLTGNEGLPKSTCLTPCFVMGFCTVAGIKKKWQINFHALFKNILFCLSTGWFLSFHFCTLPICPYLSEIIVKKLLPDVAPFTTNFKP